MTGESATRQRPDASWPIADGSVEGERHRRACEQILAAATRELTSNPRASLSEIARAAGIGRTTLHRYFPTRDALVAAVTTRALSRLEEAFARVDFEQPFPDALARLVREVLPLGPEMVFVGNNGSAWEAGDEAGRYERFSALLARAAERAQERGEVRPGIPPWWVAEFVMLTLWGAWYLVSGGYVGPRALPDMALDTLLHGIAPTESTVMG